MGTPVILTAEAVMRVTHTTDYDAALDCAEKLLGRYTFLRLAAALVSVETELDQGLLDDAVRRAFDASARGEK